MTASFLRVFPLTQHTPIIHFQHDQAGATLRATELKPKLDLFLIEHLLRKWGIPFNYHRESQAPPNYVTAREAFGRAVLAKDAPEDRKAWADCLVGTASGHLALDYKVQVITESVERKPITKNDRVIMYFGNMGDEYQKKPMGKSMAKNPQVIIKSKHKDLIALVDQYFPDFLLRTNFGTRQNKGYGAFYLRPLPSEPSQLGQKADACLTFKSSKKKDAEIIEEAFLVIDYYYKRLKSGINHGYKIHNHKNHCEYEPSFLRDYVAAKGEFRWEKKWMKEKFFPLQASQANYRFARAQLGLYPAVKFITKKNPCHEGVLPQREISLTVKCANEEIARNKSPFTFKPIIQDKQVAILVFVEDIDWSPLMDQEFIFDDGRHTHTIRTPQSPINLKALLREYHQSLKDNEDKSFTASDFTGSKKINVSL